MKVRQLTLTALFAALIAVGAFIKIPMPLIPITLQTLFVTLAGMLLGKKFGALSVCVYVAVGLVGIPVFTGGGGIGYVLKPTFGYLIGFCVGAYVVGAIARKVPSASVASASVPSASMASASVASASVPSASMASASVASASVPSVSMASASVASVSFKRLLCAGLCGMLVIYGCGMAYYYLMATFYSGTHVELWPFVLNFFLLTLPGDIVLNVLAAALCKKLIPVISRFNL